jgi:hypothetical protein
MRDGADLCTRSYCSRSMGLHVQRKCCWRAAEVAKAVVRGPRIIQVETGLSQCVR